MTQEQFSIIGTLYLIGMFVYTLWLIVDYKGFKGLRKKIKELAKRHGTTQAIAATAIILIDATSVIAWPAFMHLMVRNEKLI